MGRSYWFECARCGYRARVSGRADRGLSCYVQTILCRDCRELYDAVTRLKVVEDNGKGPQAGGVGLLHVGLLNRRLPSSKPPPFQHLVNQLPFVGGQRFRWLQFKIQCPVSPLHRVEAWSEPDKCPRCGVFLEKNALPYRLWE